jgi:hypothetical protein
MKNKIIIFSLFASSLVVILYSCKRDFLEVAPLGTYNQPQLTNKQGVNGMLISTYAALGGLQGTQLTGASNWAWGGEAYKGTEPTDFVNINAIMRYEVQPSLPNVLTKWNASFEGIGRANQVLRSVAEAKDLSDAEKSQIIGEARFLRGHYHFELKKIWNNIPFVDETHIPLVADFKIPNMDASGNYINIWPQIEADLKFAYDNLDEAKPNRGRANKWAAASFLAKAYMFQNKFAEAKALFDLIIANGKNPQNVKYDLTPNYQSNFRITQENNSETVFAIQYSYGDGSNTNGNYDNSLNYPHNTPAEFGAGCCGFFQPSQTFVNAFKTTADGLPMLDNFNETDVTSDEGVAPTAAFTPYQGTLDPRLDWTVGRRGIPYQDWGIFPGSPWIRKQDYGGPYAPKKNVFYKSDNGTSAGSVGWGWNNNALNFTIIRFADVLLMAAEAEIEVGSLAKAAEYINRVRARAAASPVVNGAAPAANYLVSPYTSFAGKDDARKAVRMERMLELGMEGHRFFDLNRWGITADYINNVYLSKEKVRRASALGGAVFTKNKDEYQPIPEFAINQSIKEGTPTLKQNPGYQ